MRLGKYGEIIASKYLQQKGYEIIQRNYRWERAEIDLILTEKKNKLLIFVEVKTRRSKSYGEPEDAIIERKTRRIFKTAQGFLIDNPQYEDYEKRFDVVAINIYNKKKEIYHIINAF